MSSTHAFSYCTLSLSLYVWLCLETSLITQKFSAECCVLNIVVEYTHSKSFYCSPVVPPRTNFCAGTTIVASHSLVRGSRAESSLIRLDRCGE